MESLANFIDDLNNKMVQMQNILAEIIEALFEKIYSSIPPYFSRSEKENGTKTIIFVIMNDLFKDDNNTAENRKNGQNSGHDDKIQDHSFLITKTLNKILEVKIMEEIH